MCVCVDAERCSCACVSFCALPAVFLECVSASVVCASVLVVLTISFFLSPHLSSLPLSLSVRISRFSVSVCMFVSVPAPAGLYTLSPSSSLSLSLFVSVSLSLSLSLFVYMHSWSLAPHGKAS